MQRALASGAIVSSLFPSHIRDQLYQETAHQNHQAERAKQFKTGDKNGDSAEVTNFLKEEGGGKDGGMGELVQHASPLACKYNDCTLMFADLQGFTKWSAERDAKDGASIRKQGVPSEVRCAISISHVSYFSQCFTCWRPSTLPLIVLPPREMFSRCASLKSQGEKELQSIENSFLSLSLGGNDWRLLRGRRWFTSSQSQSCRRNGQVCP